MLRLQKKWGRQEGFTLIELLVVVAILGVLVGIAAPRVVQSLQGARTNRDNTNKRIVQTAIERYAFDNSGAYPLLSWDSGTSAWVATTTLPATGNYRIDFSKLVGGPNGYLTDYPAVPEDINKRFVVDTQGTVKLDAPTVWTTAAQNAASGPGDTTPAKDRP